ncbi:competence protein CoiA family protein [Pseudalkalibacillus hwajinpoensis]|uniref:competence protein CoiA family protein n=1 Tax=Guptibacillus hwajinpoensis TaxID=208199 RepID=UPI00325A5854
MLTAITKEGILLNLADTNGGLNELRKLRSTREYFCPACGSRVIMKLGEKKIWHFSHHGKVPCLTNSEVESLYHLQGKTSAL